MKQEAEAVQTNGQSTSRHVFGSNCKMVEVFFQIHSYGERAPPISRKATLEDTQALGSNFEQIDIRYKRFYIRDYVEKSMSWNMEEYASVNPPAIPKDPRHKDYEEWLLSHPHLCWPPWAWAGVYHWGIWMEQII
ncbi:hypothetical protein B9Z19DRAFT_1137417 [Tuber borchii]|uniref:Uncharacterized protein n=1 Tax=Tuber borchii TaxID=42251 RepID=A0A2T6ZAI9_TUBBO|nr:hypothetical protein B9Z19DRAFT_1137417 [Tuber borchii]